MKLKRLFFFLIVLLGLALPVFAQSTLDSLNTLLKQSTSDSLKVRILVKLCDIYKVIDIDQAQNSANEALRISERENWEWGLLESSVRKGTIATLKGDFTTALKYDNQYLKFALRLKDSLATAKAYNNIGQDYSDLGKYDDAYYYITKGYKAAKLINDTLSQAIDLYNLGNVFEELAQYDMAMDHFAISSELSKKIDDFDGAAYIADGKGSLYLHKKDYKMAEENLLTALKIERERNLLDIEPRTLVKLARLYLEKEEYPKAFSYYEMADQLYTNSRNTFGQAVTRLGKGKVSAHQQQFSTAMALINEALSSAKILNARILEIECIEQLSLLYEFQGDFKKAFSYYKEFKAMSDSNQQYIEKLFLDLRSETQTKDSEIEELSLSRSIQEAEIKRQSFITNILAVLATLSVILLFSVYRSNQRRIKLNKLLMEHQNEIKKRSLELEQLNDVKDKFFSIISHDLRSPINGLTGILDLLDKDLIKPDELPPLIKELKVQFNHTKSLINNLLDWALLQMDKLTINPQKINVCQLVDENIKLLSRIQPKSIEMINLVPESLYAMADLNTLRLVFRNLILNSIKFTNNGGKIWVEAKESENELTISVSDNGVGMTREVQAVIFDKAAGYTTPGTANEKGTGLGLILCKEFVERNGGKIWVKSEEGEGSTFSFTLKRA